MKKLLFIILLLLWVASGVRAADKIADIESEIKTVMDRVSPSLVKVVAENARKYVATGIVLEDGLIVTSSLVTRHPFERIFVETTKGETIAARIAGQDNRSGLALLRLEKNGLRPLPQAGPAGVGNWVALVGLFYDRFPAIFQGIVSSRSENELLLNAPVAPGAAGGAVVNKKGELLGIIRGNVGFSFSPDFTFRDHAASIVVGGRKNESGSLCYAIPIQQVRRIAEILKTTGRVVPGWLGVILAGNSNLVQQVYKESPAAKAGITGGDRIDELAGKPIADFPDIATALEFRYAGDRVGVRINRAGKPLRLNVVLGEHRDGDEPVPPLPGDVPEAPEIPGFADLAERLAEMPELSDLETALPRVRNYVIEFAGARQLGIDVMEITADLGRKFAVKEGYGLLVSRVNEGSAARKAGLQAGDVIVRAKGGAVRTTSDLRQALNSLKEKETILLELYRDGQLKKFQLLPDL
ncbi:MAG: PDZ domain-containing protein, partial [Acidobacteriota bacterium]|nr:PDZ domain-containing protein [Acidobacteriota bacterium]